VLDQRSQAALSAATASRVLSVARSYLGVPYRLGGASRNGIDCSGLVMVAYRDGAGIRLPHKATLQAARARKVPDDQARPGDLVAWGVPGNYPHIALVVDKVTCIGAWTWGIPAKYGKIHQKAVPGFGYPDILRVIG
jgi:cell wall-associated NlpC family hydrolase